MHSRLSIPALRLKSHGQLDKGIGDVVTHNKPFFALWTGTEDGQWISSRLGSAVRFHIKFVVGQR